jgi:DNA-binding transcriptional ArsR family regulator
MLRPVTSDVFAVLADPTRRRLLEALASGERSVNELVRGVDIEQPGVSRHLRILEAAGFVLVRPEGQRRWYSLRTEPFEVLAGWMQKVARDQAGRLQRLADLVEEPETARTKGRKR